jgi:hypothetical protein
MDAQTQRQINAQLLRKTILAPFSLEAKFFSPERAHGRGDAIFWSVGREAKTKGYFTYPSLRFQWAAPSSPFIWLLLLQRVHGVVADASKKDFVFKNSTWWVERIPSRFWWSPTPYELVESDLLALTAYVVSERSFSLLILVIRI